ncbi:UNVERIFIED_CONTAM: hypothetical protein PYX00_001902 [Menopon gallinae]|uniref:Uncharacterized protein n=1 Tax=Menopon gallinae TaxID=328185 RepID=A0AAW2IFU0_9NEOP
MTRTGMRTTTVLILAIVVASGEACSVRDANGNAIRGENFFVGSVSRDARIGDLLPGEVRLRGLRPREIRGGNCSAGLATVFDGDRLRFRVAEEFPKTGQAVTECTFAVTFDGDEGCPSTVSLKCIINDYDLHAPAFEKDNYSFRGTFPLPKGARVGDGEIAVTDPDFSNRRINLAVEESFDGIEVVRIGSPEGKTSRFELRTTKLLYLQEDLNLTLIATVEPGELSSKARLKLQMNEDSGIPRPEFEKSFYDVIVHESDLNAGRGVYPAGTIKLKDDYSRLGLSLRPLQDYDLKFAAVHVPESRTVEVRLLEPPKTNLSSQYIVLNLTARITVLGRESEGSTLLLVRLLDASEMPVFFEPENTEHLRIAVIVLSVVVVILLFLIIFGYFKYVCVRKRESEPPPCRKCSAPPKTRRPTPRKISEYTYPLDKMPAPLEPLPESDVEEDGDGPGKPRPQIAEETSPKPSTSGAKTRKRSITFIESDEESRQNRESLEVKIVDEKERKVSRESQKSTGEERRRRKSSTKMYHSLT